MVDPHSKLGELHDIMSSMVFGFLIPLVLEFFSVYMAVVSMLIGILFVLNCVSPDDKTKTIEFRVNQNCFKDFTKT